MALLRTASVVTRAFARLVEPSGLSWPQYNALRIVRGAGSGGIATLAIRERMIDEGTTITRLLDKLEAAGLIRRERSLPDRRQVLCFVTPEGRRLLDGLDPKVDALDEAGHRGIVRDPAGGLHRPAGRHPAGERGAGGAAAYRADRTVTAAHSSQILSRDNDC